MVLWSKISIDIWRNFSQFAASFFIKTNWRFFFLNCWSVHSYCLAFSRVWWPPNEEVKKKRDATFQSPPLPPLPLSNFSPSCSLSVSLSFFSFSPLPLFLSVLLSVSVSVSLSFSFCLSFSSLSLSVLPYLCLPLFLSLSQPFFNGLTILLGWLLLQIGITVETIRITSYVYSGPIC